MTNEPQPGNMLSFDIEIGELVVRFVEIMTETERPEGITLHNALLHLETEAQKSEDLGTVLELARKMAFAAVDEFGKAVVTSKPPDGTMSPGDYRIRAKGEEDFPEMTSTAKH